MKGISIDQELESLKTVLHALEPLDESQRHFVLKTTVERLKISILPTAAGNHQGQPNGEASPNGVAIQSGGTTVTNSNNGSITSQTAKQFLKAKQPKTDVLRIACLAYFSTHAKNQPHFKTEDLIQLNTDAGGTKLSNPWQTVKNAMRQNGFLAPVEKGMKQITGFGEDVVDALPSEEAVAAVLANHRKPRKKTTKKAAPKAK
ncbi:MAG: polyketide synthase [Pedosphaera sp.]|nr:polyketide synthase [Pedosphaera sp.]